MRLFICLMLLVFNLFLPVRVGASIFGVDRRSSIPYQGEARKIVKIITPNGLCSGFFAGHSLVVTSKHCLEDVKINFRSVPGKILRRGIPQNSTDIKVYPLYSGPGTSNFAGVIEVYTDTDDYDFSDWAILKLNQKLGQSFGYFPVTNIFENTTGKYTKNLTFMAFHSDKNYGNQLNLEKGCEIKKMGSRGELLHNCGTFCGSSGAPLLKCDSRGNNCLVVGLHYEETICILDAKSGHTLNIFPIWIERFSNLALNPTNFQKFLKDLDI